MTLAKKKQGTGAGAVSFFETPLLPGTNWESNREKMSGPFSGPPLSLVHCQIETIHPFLDGNGRVARLLITFQLCWQKIMQRPLLYLSDYFKRHQEDNYQRLPAVRDRDEIEAWLEFFFTGVRNVALDATTTATRIQELRDRHRALISGGSQAFRSPVSGTGHFGQAGGGNHPPLLSDGEPTRHDLGRGRLGGTRKRQPIEAKTSRRTVSRPSWQADAVGKAG